LFFAENLDVTRNIYARYIQISKYI
jgi:hypothetical protein